MCLEKHILTYFQLILNILHCSRAFTIIIQFRFSSTFIQGQQQLPSLTSAELGFVWFFEAVSKKRHLPMCTSGFIPGSVCVFFKKLKSKYIVLCWRPQLKMCRQKTHNLDCDVKVGVLTPRKRCTGAFQKASF